MGGLTALSFTGEIVVYSRILHFVDMARSLCYNAIVERKGNVMTDKYNTDFLRECLSSWVDTFNDCACCPLFWSCDQEGGIDCYDCTDKILEKAKEAAL